MEQLSAPQVIMLGQEKRGHGSKSKARTSSEHPIQSKNGIPLVLTTTASFPKITTLQVDSPCSFSFSASQRQWPKSPRPEESPEPSAELQESTGKSTLLERLTGLPIFPRNADLCTRALIKAGVGSADTQQHNGRFIRFRGCQCLSRRQTSVFQPSTFCARTTCWPATSLQAAASNILWKTPLLSRCNLLIRPIRRKTLADTNVHERVPQPNS